MNKKYFIKLMVGSLISIHFLKSKLYSKLFTNTNTNIIPWPIEGCVEFYVQNDVICVKRYFLHGKWVENILCN